MKESEKMEEDIGNFELITSEIGTTFSCYKFKFITGFRFFKVHNKYYEEVPILEMELEYKEDKNTYIITLQFKGVQNLHISSTADYGIQLSSFEIIDIKDDGWCDLNYKVNDYETENVTFYCNHIEVISINKM
ncbi:hypothetical protein [Paenibacillus turpanensis]|uniref:hypothetical protein n=1 Tax=Paenibacillus turpanensis TaxID=2689078 RepID=UPI001409B7AE|nr:hypothetical protein [Paenibacillus turpanensis]